MRIKNKRTRYVFMLTGGILLFYIMWLSLRLVRIIAVHQYRHFSDVLVENFPLTDKGKINWWLKNKDMIRKNYGIPKPDTDGSYNIVFWNFGEGYKETDGYDRLCFDDMHPPLNCIDKDAVLYISNSINLGVIFTVYDGKYQLKEKGNVVRFESKFEVKRSE